MRYVIPRRLGHADLVLLPGLAIAVVAVADLAVHGSVVLGLVVVAPLLAANVAGPRVTATATQGDHSAVGPAPARHHVRQFALG